MPYLDSKIDTDKHKKDCGNPVAKRLYIRDYDDKGKQRFVPWGLTCTSCGVVVPNEEKYQHSLTPTERKYKDEETLNFFHGIKIRDKLHRLRRKHQGPITSKERGLRIRISNMGKFYNLMSRQTRDPSVSGPIKTVWDEKLVNQFLDLNPRPTLIELEHVFGSKRDKYRSDFELSLTVDRGWDRRGYVEDPDKPGWLKYDFKAYAKLLISEAERRKELMRIAIRQRDIEPIDLDSNHVPWHNIRDVRMGKIILKMGKMHEEDGTIPRHEICARMLSSLLEGKEGSDADEMKSDIERLCPPEWKSQTIKSVIE
jgi:hypothetical protein